jgi:hypothetical protein
MKWHGRLVLLVLITSGCEDRRPNPPEDPADAPVPLAMDFDATTAGTIRGQVTWDGAIPAPPALEVWSLMVTEAGTREKHCDPNPNAPVVDPATRGVGHVVVFLRGVDPNRSKPWNHPPVRIEQRRRQFHVLQGALDSRVGFVRRGDSIRMVSREPVFHSLHASGAAFFTLAFPDPDDPCARRLTTNGVVELTSAAGHYPMRGYLFVDEHPYYTRTDAQGRFVLEQVPPGRYEVVCWMANWIEARHERDPETNIVTRLFFRPPLEHIQTVTVPAGEPGTLPELHFRFSGSDFSGP